MQPGAVLNHRYRLVSLLGRGGMGTVWRADHLGLNAPVAVKLLAPELANGEEAIQRFQREAQSAATLRSPHVVQILDHGIDDESRAPFIVMELLEGESLSERLSRKSRLSPQETCHLVQQIARALARAHDIGVVHRDLKPGNVFLVKNEDETVAKVLDFGIAKWQPESAGVSNLTGTHVIMGTPVYMSPEQLAGARFVDHRTDLWALAVIAFECLTGSRPFTGENMMAIAMKVNSCEFPKATSYGGLPAACDAFFTRALAKRPDARFQSARELAEELRRATGVGVFTPFGDGRPRAGTPELRLGTDDIATLQDGQPAHTLTEAGDSPRTVTAVAATPPEPRPPRPRSKALWGIAAAVGVAGVALSLLLLPGKSEPLPEGMGSAAASVFEHAAAPRAPHIYMPSAAPAVESADADALIMVTPSAVLGAAPPASAPVAEPIAEPPKPAAVKPAAPKPATPKPAAPATQRPATTAAKKPATNVFDSRR